MRFNILVTTIENARSKAIVAHNLAGNRSVSLQHALSLLENLPVIYQVNLLKDDACTSIARLAKIGVKANAVAMESESRPHRDNKEQLFVVPMASVSAPLRETTPKPENIPKLAIRYVSNPISVQPEKKIKSGKKIKVSAIIILLSFVGLAVICGRGKIGGKIPLTKLSGQVIDSTNRIDSCQARPGGKKREHSPLALSNTYSDSAKASTNPGEAITFYRMALSFNKRNIEAWYGLINAYNLALMPNEAHKASEEMKKILGEGISSLSQIVRRFGEIIALNLTDDSTQRVEYQSNRGGKDELLHEVFLLGKALSTQCNCASLSLYAHTGKSTGVLVYIKSEGFPVSYDGFIAKASVTYLR